MRPIASTALVAAIVLTRSTTVWTALPAAPGTTALIVRHHPTKVRWGEVTASEATRVEVPLPGRPSELDEQAEPKLEATQFAQALGLTFQERSRLEEIETLRSDRPQAQVEVTPYGSVMLAMNTEDRRVWERFREALVEQASRLSPAGYGLFLGRFGAWVEETQSGPGGEYSLVFCITVEGQDAAAAKVERRVAAGPQGGTVISAGFTGFRESRPICSALRSALQYTAPTEARMTDLQVEETLEEALSVVAVARPDAAPGPWPEGAKLEHIEPPDGRDESLTAPPSSMERISESNGAAHYESWRRTGLGGAKPYHLIADAAPARLDLSLAAGRALVTRWTLENRLRHLGDEPRTLQEETDDLLLALYPQDAPGRLAFDTLERYVAEAVERESGLMRMDVVRNSIVQNFWVLGSDRYLAVLCRTKDQVEEAEYCLARACARVTNPVEFCSAVRMSMID